MSRTTPTTGMRHQRRHFTANPLFGVDVRRDASRRAKLSQQVDVENIADHVDSSRKRVNFRRRSFLFRPLAL